MNPKSEVFHAYSQIHIDAARVPWETGSPSLWSLLDMVKAYGHIFYYISTSLARLQGAQYPDEDQPISDTATGGVITILVGIHATAKEVGLLATSERIMRLAKKVRQRITPGEYKVEVRYLSETLEDELKTKGFLHIPDNYVAFYEAKHLFGKGVAKAFPSANFDVQEAGTCLACGRYTASIFHLMCATEYALRALANDRRVTLTTKGGKPFPTEMGTWEDVLKALDTEIGKISEWPRTKGEAKLQALQFYNSAIEELRAIKEAWRNPVMHARTHYLREDAEQVLAHVLRLMQSLSTRITETERTPRVWTKAQLR